MKPEQETKILDLIVGLTGTDEVLAERDIDLFEAGLLDSLGFVELLVALDNEFDLAVSPTEVDRDEVATVNKLLAFVAARL
jgi:D-alanine--poly(phosphoribitol) ligase subunit 2